ncbi:hypothetical protein LX36DRAFT_17067 [Colletotrichum falcatum]|nr:hypothetical protein LX36DRAFT_17067 [Colletotrichum falcatum]
MGSYRDAKGCHGISSFCVPMNRAEETRVVCTRAQANIPKRRASRLPSSSGTSLLGDSGRRYPSRVIELNFFMPILILGLRNWSSLEASKLNVRRVHDARALLTVQLRRAAVPARRQWTPLSPGLPDESLALACSRTMGSRKGDVARPSAPSQAWEANVWHYAPRLERREARTPSLEQTESRWRAQNGWVALASSASRTRTLARHRAG